MASIWEKAISILVEIWIQAVVILLQLKWLVQMSNKEPFWNQHYCNSWSYVLSAGEELQGSGLQKYRVISWTSSLFLTVADVLRPVRSEQGLALACFVALRHVCKAGLRER